MPAKYFGANKTEITRLIDNSEFGLYRNIGGILAGQDLNTGDAIACYYGYEVSVVDEESKQLFISDINDDGYLVGPGARLGIQN